MENRGRPLLRPEEIRRANGHVMELMSLYLNLEPAAITGEMVQELAAEVGYSEEEAYAEFLGALCGLDAGGRDKALFRNYFLPMVHKIDITPFKEDPYYKNIRFPDAKSGKWEFRTLTLAPYEAFVAGDPDVLPDGRMIPRIGFFEKAFSYPAVLEDGREWMTLLPNETITTEPALREASGRVLTYGLGLGYFVYRALLKPEVTSVTVVEKSRDAMGLFREFLLPQFPGDKELILLEDDAFSYAETKAPLGNFDFIFADIWHDAGDGPEMYRRFKALEHLTPGAKHAYWLEDTIRCYEDKSLWP